MLAEVEDRIVKVLQEKLVEIPSENIGINTRPAKLPAIIISGLKIKFQKAGLAENIDQGKLEQEEKLSSDGAKTSYKLKEKPLKNSVHVESPLGILLTEKEDYSVNYAEGEIEFKKAPEKGKGSIFVKYLLNKSVMMLKSLKVKALYAIDVWASDRGEADSVAEKVVKALLTVEDQLLAEGIDLKPVGGIFSLDGNGKNRKVQLKYVVEREVQVDQVVGPMERIDITSKNL